MKLITLIKVAFSVDTLMLRLSDGRVLQLEMSRLTWLRWLLDATPQQRQLWEIVPSGGGVWWPESDDGVELQPLLDVQSLI